MEINENGKINGSPDEIAQYFNLMGCRAPGGSKPDLSEAFNGWWIATAGLIAAVLMIATALNNGATFAVLFILSLIAIGVLLVLILCKYRNTALTYSILGIIIIIYALILGVLRIDKVSDKLVNKIEVSQ